MQRNGGGPRLQGVLDPQGDEEEPGFRPRRTTRRGATPVRRTMRRVKLIDRESSRLYAAAALYS